MALINDIKKTLRITTDTLDAEVQDLIDSAVADLILSGVLKSKTDTMNTSSPDALIKRCISLYCKAYFGLESADSEKYHVSYVSLKTHLALSQEYTIEVAG